MAKSASLEPEVTVKEKNHALPEPWCPLSVLSLLGAGPVSKLLDKAEVLELVLEDSPAGPCIETVRRGALLSHEMLKLVQEYKPLFGPLLGPDHESLGFSSLTDERDVLRLCKLRGVLFDGEDQIDRRGLVTLSKLLDAERRFPRADFDWLLCMVANPHLKSNMFTEAKWESDPPAPPEPPPPQPWDNPQRTDIRKVAHRIKYDPYEEAVNRCLCLGIRTEKRGLAERGPSCLGIDLYRRLGLVVLDRRNVLTERAIDKYEMMQAMAYRDVFAQPKEQTHDAQRQ